MRNRLKQVLDTKGISQKELAYMTGYTESTISNYAKGRRKGSIFAWIMIADALGEQLDDLLVSEEYCKQCRRKYNDDCKGCVDLDKNKFKKK